MLLRRTDRRKRPTARGAVSIARRLQDPLAELVKIDPKAIGVGQYQHDLDEVKLSRSLDGVVEDCVNARRRRCQHGVGAAGARLRHRRRPRTKHRPASRDARPVPEAGGVEAGQRGWGRRPSSWRWLPSHSEWRRPARRLGRASGSLPGRAAHPGDDQRLM